MHKAFESERLTIRPTLKQDSELFYQLMNTPKFISKVGDKGIKSIENAENYIQDKMISQLNDLGFSSYSLITKSGSEKIGICGLFNREGVDGIDIGFVLLPQFEGLGYAYEAAKRVLEVAFEEFKLKEVKAITKKGNIPSQRLLEKLGMERAGTTKLPNEDDELLMYIKRNKMVIT